MLVNWLSFLLYLLFYYGPVCIVVSADVTCSSPDEKSVITYVSMFLRHCPDMAEVSASSFVLK